MFRLRSVAGFARDHDVLAQLLLIDHISMAGFANIVPGEGHGSGCDLGNGGTTIVSVLSETLGDDHRPQGDKCNQGDRNDHR